MINVIMITLTLFGGGTLDVNRDSIEAIEDGNCNIRYPSDSWMKSDRYEKVSCREIILKSRETARVLETREEILKKIKGE